MANRLKEIRKSKRLLQKEIANYLNIAVSTYSYWENGTYDIDNTSLQKLADYYAVSVDYLLGRAEPTQLHIPDRLKNIPVAFHGGIDSLTQEDIDDVAKYLEFIRERRRKQNKGE